MTYLFKKQLANETTVTIETNNRDFFIGIEELITEFIEEFTNRNEDECTIGIEKSFLDGIENIKWSNFGNEERSGIRIEKNNGNEETLQIQNIPEKKSGNELPNLPISITTKFGTAYLGKGDKYFKITSNKEGNLNKLLHRLIWEDYHNATLMDWAVIHHIDNNKLNNNIDNLIAVSKADHNMLHGKKLPERKERTLIDDGFNEDVRISRNSTGYYGVYKQVCPRCSQGFTWKYTYKENGVLKTLESVNLLKLEKKVRAKGLHWQKL